MKKVELKYIDISLPIHSEMLVWEDDHLPVIDFCQTIEQGFDANVSKINMSVHTGTHVDAPLHFIDGGKRLEEMDLSILIGEAYVFETSENVVTRDVLKNGKIPKTKRLLIKTKNRKLYEKKMFDPSFTALDESAADWILENDICLVGIDYLSIEIYENKKIGYPVHKKLLRNEVLLLEGLVLNDVSSGLYQLTALPLNLLSTEAAPVRAILFPASQLLSGCEQ